MFASLVVILPVLFLFPALSNGIRLAELPADGDSIEIVVGYGEGGLNGLQSTSAARALLLNVYAAGGKIEFIEELDRTGFRFTVPQWALAMVTAALPALFEEIPKQEISPPAGQDFQTRIEDEIRTALIVSTPVSPEYATDKAFVLISGPVPETLRTKLEAIPRRPARQASSLPANRLSAERKFRFQAELPTGAVIFASPLPGVFYREWYSILLLDRLIRRVVPLKVSSNLVLTLTPHYYRMEVPVPAGEFPDPVEEKLIQEIQRLQLSRATPRDLDAARQDAREYLESRYVREWFASHDIADRREEAIQWIQSMTADDMRVAARDLLGANHVLASWAPKVKQTSVEVESLSSSSNPVPPGEGRRVSAAPGEGSLEQSFSVAPFPTHTDPSTTWPLAERLSSGVSLVPGNGNAVFVSGGPLARFDREPDSETLRTFQRYRADRILVLSPSVSMDHARQLWTSFKGANNGELGVAKGKVTTGDLPALCVLKTLIERKIMEAGWWRDVSLQLDASYGSDLRILANEEKRSTVLSWIKKIASEKPSEPELLWSREVAIHRIESIRPDIQAILWERDPQVLMQDLATISAAHVSDVARIYF